MSDLTPQEIRDRLARVEVVLAEIHEEITSDGVADANILTALLCTKATTLNAAALTLLVEEQQQANRIATAQVYATMGPSMFSQARVILDA